jgi:GT2 family glycosyltransferase
LETLALLQRQLGAADELVVIDQTEQHEPATEADLERLHASHAIRWIRQHPPSITAAMNRGLLEARGEVVLFVDDDIVPGATLLSAHRDAHVQNVRTLIAGKVIQPWHVTADAATLRDSAFVADEPRWVDEFMGGNFSVERDQALALGGFDENFVQVAYRFEAEFANRLRASGARIRFEPRASLHHLHVARGGTRSYGEHLTTMKPAHAVGAYYFALRTQRNWRWMGDFASRMVGSIATRHHLWGPWWVPVTLAAELRGMWWAYRLHHAGPRLIETSNVP